jgi:hypothetical protein
MMMRRVQTAAGASGGGEGASDVLDGSDVSVVIFVSCNASAILAGGRWRCWISVAVHLICLHEAKLLPASKGELRVYATFNFNGLPVALNL